MYADLGRDNNGSPCAAAAPWVSLWADSNVRMSQELAFIATGGCWANAGYENKLPNQQPNNYQQGSNMFWRIARNVLLKIPYFMIVDSMVGYL